MATTVKELQDFLVEAELQHYYSALKNELKITTIAHLKYVKEDDLMNVGMTKPEMRRLKRYYKKECPQGTLGKIRKAIMRASDGPGRSLSPSPPEHRISRPISCIRPSGKQIIPAESITSNKVLGEGEFGVVQQGTWTTEYEEKVQVAIKCLSKDRMQNGVPEFLKEAAIMQTIDHDNIVRMFGVVLDKDNCLMLVTELAPMRSLLECLKEPSLRLDFPIPHLCDFAQQICDGMSYLESKRLIHRDLAARNILVFSKNKVKISDFGLSRAIGVGKDYYQSNFSINLKLPVAWCAPECINYLKFTSASDIWAFGVTLWELFTYGFQPWAGMTGQQILEAVDKPNSQRLERPDLCPKEYYDLMLKCWEDEPKTRPTFSEVFIKLPQIRPVQVKAVKNFPEATVPKDYLYYKPYDVIIVLDKTHHGSPAAMLWKGALNTGKCGWFDPTNTVPFIEPKTSPIELPRTTLTRKESSRKSGRKLRVDMISHPKNDLRHTGHIGYDGAVFGDIPFIRENYDKLPVKVSTTGKLTEESRGASMSLPKFADSPARDRVIRNSQSDISLNQDGSTKGTNGFAHSWMSRDSLESSSTMHSTDKDQTPPYHDIDDEDDDLFGEFKLPDLTTSLDFGPSFMDEVMKALQDKHEEVEKSPVNSKENAPSTVFSATATSSVPRDTNSVDYQSAIPPSPTDKSPLIPPPSFNQDLYNDSKPESRKQVKVKPMSTSDEKMIDEAIDLANQCALQCNRSEMVGEPSSPVPIPDKNLADSECVSESPTLISKLKMSIKRSPKEERKRTFSEEIATKADFDEDLPPEAQEAYNILVVRGSVKNKAPEIPPRDSTPERPPSFDMAPVVKNEVESKPLPKPRPTVEPPLPPVVKPRPEIHRVEPTPRLEASAPLELPEKMETIYHQSSAEMENGISSPILPEIRPRFSKESSPATISERSVEEQQMEYVVIDTSEEQLAPSEKRVEMVMDSKKEASLKTGFEEEFTEPSPREIMSKLARESRIRRSLDHQRGLSLDSADQPHFRNLREPQGIPTKVVPTTNGDDDEVDTNPLRMLRGGAIPIRGGRGGQGMDSSHLPRLQFTNPHFQQSVSKSVVKVNVSTQQRPPAIPPRTYCSNGDAASVNPLPLPPRKPHRPGDLYAKPRERKYPLLLTSDSGCTSSLISQPVVKSLHVPSPDLPPAPPPPLDPALVQDDLDDDVFHSESPSNTFHYGNGGQARAATFPRRKYSLHVVQCNLEQLGLHNHDDPFWVKRVKFSKRNYSDNESSDEPVSPITANYKTSDKVSYEDLLEFALDRKKNCPELEALLNFFSNEVSVADCKQALTDTKWNVQNAIKYIKLKQLLSIGLGDVNYCKEALMKCDWDVKWAADHLLSNPETSPEIVYV